MKTIPKGGRIVLAFFLFGTLQGCWSVDRFEGETAGADRDAADSSWNTDTGSDVDFDADLGCQTDTDTIIEGRYQWHTFFDYGGKNNIVIDSEMDRRGNVYILGAQTTGTVNPGSSQSSGTYLLTLGPTGEYVRHTPLSHSAESMALDENGNIFISGSSGPWNGPDGETPKAFHSGGDATDIYILKLAPDGQYVWHTFFGGADTDEGTALTIDRNGDIIAAGTSTYSWNGPGDERPLFGAVGLGPQYPALIDDIFVLKLDADGDYRWHGFIGGGYFSSDTVSSVKTDTSGNIYLTGSSNASWNGPDNRSPLNRHAGTIGEDISDILVLKLNPSGVYQWHTFFGSSSTGDMSTCPGDTGRDVTIDNGGDIVVSALVGNCSVSNPWPGDAPLHPHSGDKSDIAIIKLNADGTRRWYTFYPGTAGAAHTVDQDGNIYITGSAADNWEGPNGEAPLNPCGTYDILILKLSPMGEYQWHTFLGAAPFVDFSVHEETISWASGGVSLATETEIGHAAAIDGCGKLLVFGSSDYPWQGPNRASAVTAHTAESWCEVSYISEYPDHTDVYVACGGFSNLFVLGLD